MDTTLRSVFKPFWKFIPGMNVSVPPNTRHSLFPSTTSTKSGTHLSGLEVIRMRDGGLIEDPEHDDHHHHHHHNQTSMIRDSLRLPARRPSPTDLIPLPSISNLLYEGSSRGPQAQKLKVSIGGSVTDVANNARVSRHKWVKESILTDFPGPSGGGGAYLSYLPNRPHPFGAEKDVTDCVWTYDASYDGEDKEEAAILAGFEFEEREGLRYYPVLPADDFDFHYDDPQEEMGLISGLESNPPPDEEEMEKDAFREASGPSIMGDIDEGEEEQEEDQSGGDAVRASSNSNGWGWDKGVQTGGPAKRILKEKQRRCKNFLSSRWNSILTWSTSHEVSSWRKCYFAVFLLKILQCFICITWIMSGRTKICTEMEDPAEACRKDRQERMAVVGYLVAYLLIALPFAPYHSVAWILYWCQCCHWAQILLTLIQTFLLAQAGYIVRWKFCTHGGGRFIYFLFWGNIIGHVFMLLYLELTYGHQLDDLKSGFLWRGDEEFLTQTRARNSFNTKHYNTWLRSSRFSRSSDNEARKIAEKAAGIRLLRHKYDSTIFHDDPAYTKRKILSNVFKGCIVYYVILQSTGFKWLSDYSSGDNIVRAAVNWFAFYSALGIWSSAYQYFRMRRLLVSLPVTYYHWSVAFLFTVLT